MNRVNPSLVACLLSCLVVPLTGCSGSQMDPADGGQIGDGDGGVKAGDGGEGPLCYNRVQNDKFDVDVPAISLSGRITVNGKVPTSTTASVYLRNAATGDSLLLGRTGDMAYTTKLIVPGTYDVYYAWDRPDNNPMQDVPRNKNGKLMTVSVNAPGMLNVDIPAVTLSGHVTVNGKVPVTTSGSVYLRNPVTTDSVFLGKTGDMAYAPKMVLPGTYEISYTWEDSNNPMQDAPRNKDARLRTGAEVKDSGTLDVDVPAVVLSGHITVAGKVPVSNAGSLYLRSPVTSDSMFLGRTGDMSYLSKMVIPGTYDVYYAWDHPDNNPMQDVPRNLNARLLTGVVVKDAKDLDVDVPAVTLSGHVTVAGKVPVSTAGTVSLRSAHDSLFLGKTGDMAYTPKLVVPGTYDVYYAFVNSGTDTMLDVPRNTSAHLQTGIVVKTSGALDVNVPAITLSGHITVNTKVPTSTSGSVYLRSADDSLFLGKTGDMAYMTKLVVPGTYDVYYAWDRPDNNPMPDVPRNMSARLPQHVAAKDNTALDVDIPAVTLDGHITVNSKVPTSLSGSVNLRNDAQGDSALLGRTGDMTYTSKLIVPGSYLLIYSWDRPDNNPMSDIPHNSAAKLGCAVLSLP